MGVDLLRFEKVSNFFASDVEIRKVLVIQLKVSQGYPNSWMV